MRVLIIYSITHQHQLIEDTRKALQREGIEVDAIDITSGATHGNLPKSVYLRIYQKMCNMSRVVRIFATPLLLAGMKKILKKYQILDVHGVFAHATYPIISIAKKMGLAVKVMIWGSDFYRSSDAKRRNMKEAFNHVDIIQIASEQMKDDFIKVFPAAKSKVHLLLYGTSQLEPLLQMTEGNVSAVDNMISHSAQGKMVLCLGYNASKAQRHEQMLDAIAHLPNETKQRLFLLLPLTYGADDVYKKHVIESAHRAGVAFQSFTERLTNEQVLTLRLKTNIAINIQDTDAFAASVREHIMAKNLLVVGDWLPYQILDKNGIYVRRTSKADLRDNILWAIENYESLKPKLCDNQQRIYNLCSWFSVAKRWAELYESMVR